tara:strand:+ start:3464 stop:4534 length:1071 start_codon:yes stop_codon:yes gene_type:complete
MKFWKGGVFDPRIREKLLSIAYEFVCDEEECPVIDDIQLTGSIANYNYTTYSDLDVHILIDFTTINKDTDLVKQAFDGKRFVWNNKHNIKLRGHEVEVYYQHTEEPHVASGLYSLMNDKWITEPTYNPPSIDERDVSKKVDGIVSYIDKLTEKLSDDIDPLVAKSLYKRAGVMKEKLRLMRSAGLKREGEFSIENLAFKDLRNSGSIGNLNDAMDKAYDMIYAESNVQEDTTLTSFQDFLKKKSTDTKVVHSHDDIDLNTKFHQGHGFRGLNRKDQSFISKVHKHDGSLNNKIETLKKQPGKFACSLPDIDYIVKLYVPDLRSNIPTRDNPKELNRTKIKVYYEPDKNLFYLERTK